VLEPADGHAEGSWGMVGHEHAVRALRRALASNRLSHAYLMSGPRGVGRTTLARRLAQALSCEDEARPSRLDPCLACRACRLIDADEWPDVEHIRVGGLCDERDHRDHAADGSTRLRICQVRRLERVVTLSPMRSPYRIFILDSADDLQTEAAHALLKTLEEPPATALIILLASNSSELLPTVRSRCQELLLHPLPHEQLRAALATHSDAPPEDLDRAADYASGRFGVALQWLQDPSLRVLRESTEADIERLLAAGRNERFDYARTLGARWSRERSSVLATLDIWCDWWQRVLRASEGRAIPARDTVLALRALETARAHLLENTNPQLALEVLMLDLPTLAGTTREEALSS
jgi:DNA polymerase-3 subunit delta'